MKKNIAALRVVKIIAIIFMISSAGIGANTTRDIGPEPEINPGKTGKWIIFYTCLERVSKGLAPLLCDTLLEKAALWQAEYCVKIKTLNHYSTEQGMRTVKDRVEHFGGRLNAWGENLTVQFSMNTEGIPFYIRKDASGSYKDYGSHVIFWRDERQMAYIMVKNWMQSPGHRANILNSSFNLIGCTAAKGIYSGEKSYYGCQVFGGRGNFEMFGKGSESEFSKLTVNKNTAAGKTVYTISYAGKYEVRVMEVAGEKMPVVRDLAKSGDAWVFQKEGRPEGRLVAVLYDKDYDILYPVKIIE